MHQEARLSVTPPETICNIKHYNSIISTSRLILYSIAILYPISLFNVTFRFKCWRNSTTEVEVTLIILSTIVWLSSKNAWIYLLLLSSLNGEQKTSSRPVSIQGVQIFKTPLRPLKRPDIVRQTPGYSSPIRTASRKNFAKARYCLIALIYFRRSGAAGMTHQSSISQS